MSDSSEDLARERVEKIFKMLEDTYPYAFALFTQISSNFNKIYANVNPDSTFDKGETKYVTVGVGLDNDGNPRLAMGETATIFYTAVAYTMLEFMQRAGLPDKKIDDLDGYRKN